MAPDDRGHSAFHRAIIENHVAFVDAVLSRLEWQNEALTQAIESDGDRRTRNIDERKVERISVRFPGLGMCG